MTPARFCRAPFTTTYTEDKLTMALFGFFHKNAQAIWEARIN
jgi:hypothetical protein